MSRERITGEARAAVLAHKQEVMNEPVQQLNKREAVRKRGKLQYDRYTVPPAMYFNENRFDKRTMESVRFPPEAITKLRLQCGRTQAEQAKYLQVNIRTYQSWESAENIPSTTHKASIQRLREHTDDIPLPNGVMVREARMARGTSLETLAKYCEVSPATVYKWEQGQSNPAPKNLLKLADFYDFAVRSGSLAAWREKEMVRLIK